MMKTIDDFAVAGLPSDVIVAAEPAADTPHEVVAADAVPDDEAPRIVVGVDGFESSEPRCGVRSTRRN
jgi:hypothetical protein